MKKIISTISEIVLESEGCSLSSMEGQITPFSEECELHLLRMHKDQVFCYKIGNGLVWSFDDVGSDEKRTHWSNTIYCQLTLPLSFSYLPNRWEQSETANLFALKAKNNNLVILWVKGALLSRNDISSEAKAKIIEGLLRARKLIATDEAFYLMTWLGERNCIFCGIDAEDYEVGIPKQLLTEENFEIRPIAQFKKQPRSFEAASWKMAAAEEWTEIRDIGPSESRYLTEAIEKNQNYPKSFLFDVVVDS